jgi:gluconolactonase
MPSHGSRLRLTAAALLAGAFVPAARLSSQAPPTRGTIVRSDARMDALIPKDAALEKLADGFAWSEGPVWERKAGQLLFSDVPNNVIHKWKEGEGLGVFVRPSGYTGTEPFTGREPGSNGLTFDPQGRLTICQHGDRRIARLETQGRFTTVADRWEGKRFNSPNDLVFKSNGDLYFTDPPYGRPGTFKDPGREIPFTGVYRVTPKGTVTMLIKELTAPNGIAFSPDEKTLYVAQSDAERPVVMAFAVKDDGTVGEGREFVNGLAEVKAGKPGAFDGLKVDDKGNLFATGPGGIWVLAPDGTRLGLIDMGQPTANVGWGGDGSVLYITSNHELYRLKTTTRGRMP